MIPEGDIVNRHAGGAVGIHAIDFAAAAERQAGPLDLLSEVKGDECGAEGVLRQDDRLGTERVGLHRHLEALAEAPGKDGDP